MRTANVVQNHLQLSLDFRLVNICVLPDQRSIIIENPRILERPIITSNDNAVIGRPPENILKLFNQ